MAQTMTLENILRRDAKQYKAHLYYDGQYYVVHRQGCDWALYFGSTGEDTCTVSRRWHDPLEMHDWLV